MNVDAFNTNFFVMSKSTVEQFSDLTTSIDLTIIPKVQVVTNSRQQPIIKLQKMSRCVLIVCLINTIKRFLYPS